MSRQIPPHVVRHRLDLTALALIAVGLVGLVVVAFAVAPLLGGAVLFAEAVAVGVILAAGR